MTVAVMIAVFFSTVVAAGYTTSYRDFIHEFGFNPG
jgi:hypothetical protein